MKLKLICICKGSYNITVGKIYDAKIISHDLFDYEIINDKDYTHYIEGELFKLLRDENLELLV